MSENAGKTQITGTQMQAGANSNNTLQAGNITNNNFYNSNSTNEILSKILTYNTPPKVAEEFIGRDEIVEKLKNEEKTVLLNGMGGIGKSMICRKLFWDFYDSKDDDIKHIAWIDYSSSLMESIYNNFLNIKSDKPETYFNEFRGLVIRLGKKLVLFVDNANEITAEDIKILCGLPCRVYITSRTEIEEMPKEYIHYISSLSENECIGLYRKLSCDNDPNSEDTIKEIIKLADCHTKTVELLAKTQYKSDRTAEEILKELNNSGFTLEGIKEKIKENSLAGNNLMIEHLAKLFEVSKIADKDQLTVLTLFSLIAPNSPVERKELKEWFKLESVDSINELAEYGWINHDEKKFYIHPVVSDVVRYVQKPVFENIVYLSETFTEILKNLKDKSVSDKNRILIHSKAFIKAFEGTNDKKYAEILEETGKISIDVADYMNAIKQFEKSLEIRKNNNDELASATCYHYMGIAYGYAGDYKLCEENFETARKIREEKSEKENEETVSIYNDLGWVCNSQGKYAKALEYFNKALEVQKDVLGENHPDTATSYNNIGSVYDDMGEYDKALEYYNKAKEIREEVLGENHPDTATSYNNIGYVYNAQGEYDKALEYYNKAKEISEKVLGENHPNTAASYNNIGGVYNAQGEYDKALEYFNKALEVQKDVFGENHPDTATSYNNIGLVYHNMGEYAKALEYFNKAKEIKEEVLGENHPDTATSYNNIGGVYHNMSEYAKTLEYFNKAKEIREEVLGEKHPSTATSYNNIGGLYRSQGEYDKALEYYKKALKIVKEILGENHPYTATSYNNLSSVYKAKGDYTNELKYLEKYILYIEKTKGVNSPDNIEYYKRCSYLYLKLKNRQKAKEYQKKIDNIHAIRQKLMSDLKNRIRF